MPSSNLDPLSSCEYYQEGVAFKEYEGELLRQKSLIFTSISHI